MENSKSVKASNKECKCDPCDCDPCDCGTNNCPMSKDTKGKCPCPPECRDKMRKLKRYLNDSKFFLSKCDQCPLAKHMLKSVDELLEDFKCPEFNY
jgi:hypothetical protein